MPLSLRRDSEIGLSEKSSSIAPYHLPLRCWHRRLRDKNP
jgi:hypothetical protein